MTLEFRLWRIPVRIHVWFLVTGLMLWQLGTEAGARHGLAGLGVTLLILTQGVLMHELGHALTGRAFGMTPRIELIALGGLTLWEAGELPSPGQRMLISFAGPAVGLVLGAPALALALAAKPADPLAAYALDFFWFVNFGWAVFNLFPMMPLDGGNIMAALFELFSPRRGRLFARYVSFAVIAGLAATSAALGNGMMAFFLAFLGFMNYQGLRLERRLRERAEAYERVRARGEGSDGIDEERTLDALRSGDGPAVLAGAAAMLDAAEDEDARDEALHLMAWGHYLSGSAALARQALREMSGRRDPDPALAGAVALAMGDAAGATERLFEALAQGEPDELVESSLAKAVAHTGEYDAAFERLRELPETQVRPELLHRIETAAFAASRFEEAMRFGEHLWQRTGHGLAAFNLACSATKLGRFEEALGWLVRARDAGFVDATAYDGDDDLAPLRSLPSWTSFRESLGA